MVFTSSHCYWTYKRVAKISDQFFIVFRMFFWKYWRFAIRLLWKQSFFLVGISRKKNGHPSKALCNFQSSGLHEKKSFYEKSTMPLTKFDSMPWMEKVVTKQFSPFVVIYTDKWARCPPLRIVATSLYATPVVAVIINTLPGTSRHFHLSLKNATDETIEKQFFIWVGVLSLGRVSSCRFARESFFVHRLAGLPFSLDRDLRLRLIYLNRIAEKV